MNFLAVLAHRWEQRRAKNGINVLQLGVGRLSTHRHQDRAEENLRQLVLT